MYILEHNFLGDICGLCKIPIFGFFSIAFKAIKKKVYAKNASLGQNHVIKKCKISHIKIFHHTPLLICITEHGFINNICQLFEIPIFRTLVRLFKASSLHRQKLSPTPIMILLSPTYKFECESPW